MATPIARRRDPSAEPGEPVRARIALVASSAYPSPGGVEQHVRHVARELTSRGHAVEVWTVARDGVPSRDVVDDVPVLRLPAPLPARAVRSLSGFVRSAPRAWNAWADAVKAFRPSLLHVQCFGPNGVYALALSRRFRIPLAVSSHGETFMDEDDVFGQSALLRAALRSSFGRAAFVTGCSEYTLADLRARFGLHGGDVVFNGVDALDAPDARDPELDPIAPVGAAGAAPTVLAIGRMVRVKGFDLLLEGFRAASLPQGARLVLGGDGPERRALEASVDRLGLADRVEFLGRLDPDGVARAMAGATLLVVPSRVEAFGIVVLEGWRAGLPVVATDHGGPAEFVSHLRDGYLVDPEDPVALGRALEELLGDPALATRLGDAGAERVTAFTWAATVDAYERLYRERAALPGMSAPR
ncbi:glycosyltransferase family 4 protein [Agromyces mariniharenae]|uniref:D-inositol 3-phosphate glycosyltransferase n=1 Tax=Agromyces mariniharenae TaxID=2604423 RepID=A0A5S4V3D9_9MICO|nr:glycosyltransferase family 4 protein [Agromyces mariniharenae]TYL53647.1 glycosyltransferase family 4 protein [Agromyces mariniharenae]